MPAKIKKNKKSKQVPGSNNGNHIEEETRSNVRKVVEIEAAQNENRTFAEKLSEAIADFCGSMTFVYVHVVWFGAWVLFNSILPITPFDPFPFTFLTLVVSLEAIFLSTFILISQNHATRLTERRNHLDLQVNLMAEAESTKLLELVQAIAEKVGVEVQDPVIQALLQPIEPAKVVEQIMAESGEDPGEIALNDRQDK